MSITPSWRAWREQQLVDEIVRLADEVVRLREENTRLQERVGMYARWCSSLAGGTPLDVQLRMEEHA